MFHQVGSGVAMMATMMSSSTAFVHQPSRKSPVVPTLARERSPSFSAMSPSLHSQGRTVNFRGDTHLQETYMSDPGDVGKRKLDVDAIFKYVIAGVVQVNLIALFFKGLDYAFSRSKVSINSGNVHTCLLFAGYYALCLKSRIFNPLDNSRPSARAKSSPGFRDR